MRDLDAFDFRVACLAGFFVFSVYLLTLCPTVFMGDSGELTTAAFSLGGSHPPGYILYSIIGKAFTFLPFGNIAYRLNLVSAFFSALSSAVLFLSICRLTGSRAGALSGALFFSFSLLLWQNSVTAEVYALNLFFCSLLFLTGINVIASKEGDVRLLFFSAFVMGLGMGNHQSLALMAPALAVAFLLRWRAYLSLGNVSLSLILFAAGFSVNIALLLRGRADVLFEYSYAADWEKFIAAILRKTYDSDTVKIVGAGARPGLHWLYGLVNAGALFWREYGLYNLLWAAGLLALLWRGRRLPVFFALMAVSWTALLAGGRDYAPIDRFTVEQYLLPLFLPVCLLMGAGVSLLIGAVASFSLKRGFKLIAPAVSAAAVLLPLASVLPSNLSVADASKNYFGYQPPKDALSVLPPASLLVSFTDDYIFGGWYLQLAERYREDIVIAGARLESDRWQFPGSLKRKFHDLYPEIYSDDHGKRDLYVKGAFGEGLAFFATHREGLSEGLSAAFQPVPFGHVYLLVPKDSPMDRERLISYITSPLEKLNYERLLDVPSSCRGILTAAQCIRFSTVFWEYARGLETEGLPLRADEMYGVALEFYPKKELLDSYILFRERQETSAGVGP